MKKKEPLTWIPLYVDKWLYGSTREELTADECAVWIDFLALAAKDDGFIRASPGFPYSTKRLAGLLGRPEDLIERTIEKCLKTWTDDANEKPKLTRLLDGTLYVTNWSEYQLSDRHARRFKGKAMAVNTDAASAKPDAMAGNADARGENRIGEERKEKERIPSSSAVEDIVKKWNEFAKRKDIPWIRSIEKGSTRERHLIARLRDPSFDFDKILEAIAAQPFLLGDNDRGWLVNFDWILNPTNATKILDGAYVKVRRGDAARRAPDDPYIGSNKRR